MNSETTQLELPLDFYSHKFSAPVRNDIVRHPNELLKQILRHVDCASARKIYYIILAQDHIGEEEKLHYSIHFSEVFSAKTKDFKRRGEYTADLIRDNFQKQAFEVQRDFYTKILKKNTSQANRPKISPFEVTDFVSGSWEITLTRIFKQYLVELRKNYNNEYRKLFNFTSGDKRLLLSFKRHLSDKIYWLIRKHQWTKGNFEMEIKEFKEALGISPEMSWRSIDRKIKQVEIELSSTWCDFQYSVKKKGKAGSVSHIKFTFNKDGVQRSRLRNDYRYEFEVMLDKCGVDVDYIRNIRNYVYYKQTLKQKYTWTAGYVVHTVRESKKLYSAGKIKNLSGYLVEALYKGYFIKNLEEDLEVQDILGRKVRNAVTISTKVTLASDLNDIARAFGMTLTEYLEQCELDPKKAYRAIANGQEEPTHYVLTSEVERLYKQEQIQAVATSF